MPVRESIPFFSVSIKSCDEAAISSITCSESSAVPIILHNTTSLPSNHFMLAYCILTGLSKISVLLELTIGTFPRNIIGQSIQGVSLVQNTSWQFLPSLFPTRSYALLFWYNISKLDLSNMKHGTKLAFIIESSIILRLSILSFSFIEVSVFSMISIPI